MLLTPFRFITRILFSDLRLERDGQNLHIRIAAATPAGEPQAPIETARAEAAPSRAALKALLDPHPQARKVLRHLRYVERALATQGLAVLAAMPVEALAVALKQLDSIASGRSDRRLADLRSKMAVAVMERSNDAPAADPADRLSDFVTESRLLVEEASHSVFMELERQYHALLPQETIRASLHASRAAS